MGIIAGIVAGVASAGGAVIAAKSASDTQKNASDLATKQAADQARLEKEATDRVASEATQRAQSSAAVAKARQTAQQKPFTSGGTILTSPLGLTNQPVQPVKTLLGA